MELLLDGDEDGISAKSQIEFIRESDYEYTGSGVFIRFEHKNGIEKYRCKKNDLILSGVEIKSSELEIGANCTLFFLNGIIDNLEIWNFGGIYPNTELTDYKLTQVWNNSPGKKLKISEILRISYMTKSILINTLAFSALAVLISIIQVFVFWFMYGEGAESGRIADLWYVNLVLEYLPLVIILGVLSFRTFNRFKNEEFYKVKSNLIVAPILIVLYLLRYQIINLIG